MKYYLKAFGFENFNDLVGTLFMKTNIFFSIALSVGFGSFIAAVCDVLGFNLISFLAFNFLIIAEWWTGIKVARKVRCEKIQSRPIGRMIVKIGVYMTIVGTLNSLSTHIEVPPLFDLEINPLRWLYYTTLVFIIFQLLLSWMENLGKLGYNEAEKLSKIFKGKLSEWFEINGEKDSIKFDRNDEKQ